MDKDRYLERLADFHTRLQTLQKQWQELKEESCSLYKENMDLKRENIELKGIIRGQNSLKPHKQSGYKNLQNLYDEGYHICPLEFGERRKASCLFCQNFLQKAYEERENNGD